MLLWCVKTENTKKLTGTLVQSIQQQVITAQHQHLSIPLDGTVLTKKESYLKSIVGDAEHETCSVH